MNKTIKILWESVWLNQDKQCALCGKEVPLEETAKRIRTFNIICRECFEEREKLNPIAIDKFKAWNGLFEEEEEEIKQSCPKCGAVIIDAPGGGIKCSNPNCDYWFYY